MSSVLPPSTAGRAFLPVASLCSWPPPATWGPARPGPECSHPPRGGGCWFPRPQGSRPLVHVYPGSLGSPGAQPQSPGGGGGQTKRDMGPCQSDFLSASALPRVGREGYVAQTLLTVRRQRVAGLAGPPYLGCRGVGVPKLRVGHGGRGPGSTGGAGGVLREGDGVARPLLRGRRLLGAGRAKQKSGLIQTRAPQTFLTG